MSCSTNGGDDPNLQSVKSSGGGGAGGGGTGHEMEDFNGTTRALEAGLVASAITRSRKANMTLPLTPDTSEEKPFQEKFKLGRKASTMESRYLSSDTPEEKPFPEKFKPGRKPSTMERYLDDQYENWVQTPPPTTFGRMESRVRMDSRVSKMFTNIILRHSSHDLSHMSWTKDSKCSVLDPKRYERDCKK